MQRGRKAECWGSTVVQAVWGAVVQYLARDTEMIDRIRRRVYLVISVVQSLVRA